MGKSYPPDRTTTVNENKQAWDACYAALPTDLKQSLSLHDFKRLGDLFKRVFTAESPWLPIDTATTDGTEIWAYTAERDGLRAFQGPCAYHPDAGFCTDKLREVTHWAPARKHPLPPPGVPVVWAAGYVTPDTRPVAWRLGGVFGSEAQAVATCAGRDGWFVGPVPFDVALPDDPLLWPGLYFVAERDHTTTITARQVANGCGRFLEGDQWGRACGMGCKCFYEVGA
jgi:hypothetical protein